MKTLKLYGEFNKIEFKKLKRILLGEDGDSVAEVYEEDLETLVDDGEFFYPNELTVKQHMMEPSKCHQNVATFYKKWMNDYNSPDEISIMTGWVLNDDVWRQHSWIYFSYDDKIVETTIKRDLYYGIFLNDKDLQDFLDNND